MKINRKTVLSTAAVLGVAALVAGGTIAYFVDHDSAKNTFTLGEVDITLYESSLHRSNASIYDGQNAPSATSAAYYLFTGDINGEGKVENTNLPDNAGEAVNRTGSGGWTNKFYTDQQIIDNSANYNKNNEGVVPGYNVHKMAYVKNNGTTDTYVRVRYLIPSSVYYAIDSGRPASYWTTTALDNHAVASNAVDLYSNTLTTYDRADYANYIAAMRTAGYVDYRDANGDDCTAGDTGCIEHLVFDFTYQDALAAGEMTFWNPWGNIGVSKDATATDLENFNVIVEADGIQKTGFANATEAFAAYDAQQNN